MLLDPLPPRDGLDPFETLMPLLDNGLEDPELEALRGFSLSRDGPGIFLLTLLQLVKFENHCHAALTLPEMET